MSDAELKIRHVNYPIKSKGEAFAFNFLEGFGRASGWAIVILAALWGIDYFGDDTPEAPPTHQQFPAE